MLKRVLAVISIFGFISLLLALFFFISNRTNNLVPEENNSQLQLNEFTKNQFPKTINDAADSYTLRCIHTQTLTNQYQISSNITVKVSLVCRYIDVNLKVREVILPLVLDINEPSSRITQFLGGLKTGIIENSQMTDRGIFYLVYDKLLLNEVGGEVIAMLTNEQLIGTLSNGLKYTQEVYTENDLSTKKLENFALTGNPETLSIGKLNKMQIILPEYIVLQKIY